jgi:hypothetical protein
MDARHPTADTRQEMMDTNEHDQQFREEAQKLNRELSAYLEGQQVTRESLDLVISV